MAQVVGATQEQGCRCRPPTLTFLEIAAEMFLSPHTVKTHAKSIYRKLDASTRTQAVIEARGLGLFEA